MSRSNRRYGKLNENGKVTYAPNVLVRQHGAIICPSAQDYMQDGWLPIVDERPKCTEGFQVVSDGWRSDSEKITAAYRMKEVPVSAAQTQKKPNVVQRALKAMVMKMLGM